MRSYLLTAAAILAAPTLGWANARSDGSTTDNQSAPAGYDPTTQARLRVFVGAAQTLNYIEPDKTCYTKQAPIQPGLNLFQLMAAISNKGSKLERIGIPETPSIKNLNFQTFYRELFIPADKVTTFGLKFYYKVPANGTVLACDSAFYFNPIHGKDYEVVTDYCKYEVYEIRKTESAVEEILVSTSPTQSCADIENLNKYIERKRARGEWPPK